MVLLFVVHNELTAAHVRLDPVCKCVILLFFYAKTFETISNCNWYDPGHLGYF